MGVQAIQDSAVTAIAPRFSDDRAPEPRRAAASAHAVEAVPADDSASPRIVEPPDINGAHISLEFSVNILTGEKLLRIIDSESGRLIRQVPPEELLRVLETLRGLKGVLISTKS
jgi:flagellar protein FlaG